MPTREGWHFCFDMANQEGGEKVYSAECPECQHPIHFQRQPRKQQLIQCRTCDEIMIVTNNDPIELCEALLYAFEFFGE